LPNARGPWFNPQHHKKKKKKKAVIPAQRRLRQETVSLRTAWATKRDPVSKFKKNFLKQG
jgi:hypothetical protein